MSKKKLYAYAMADAMVDHRFTDDAAVCYAKSKKAAIARFRRLYHNADKTNVSKVRFNDYGISILTDY